jgi:hypothetical protein
LFWHGFQIFFFSITMSPPTSSVIIITNSAS